MDFILMSMDISEAKPDPQSNGGSRWVCTNYTSQRVLYVDFVANVESLLYDFKSK